jgi:hypothetical protein
MENSFDKFHQQTVHNMGKSKEWLHLKVWQWIFQTEELQNRTSKNCSTTTKVYHMYNRKTIMKKNEKK